MLLQYNTINHFWRHIRSYHIHNSLSSVICLYCIYIHILLNDNTQETHTSIASLDFLLNPTLRWLCASDESAVDENLKIDFVHMNFRFQLLIESNCRHTHSYHMNQLIKIQKWSIILQTNDTCLETVATLLQTVKKAYQHTRKFNNLCTYIHYHDIQNAHKVPTFVCKQLSR